MDSEIDVGSLRIDEGKSLGRAYFLDLVDKCESEESQKSFITLLSTLDGEALEAALPSLCDFALKCPQSLYSDLEDVLLTTLLDPSSSHGGRKASYSCLKILKAGQAFWDDFFVVAECLEEPQFHIIRPILPRVDEILKGVSTDHFPWKWATVIFVRALLHSNGWIRLWALTKSVEVDARLLSVNYKFLTDWVIPSINGNDLFWRLLEKNELHPFVAALGSLMDKIIAFLEPANSSIEALSCPVSFYFMASALQRIRRVDVLLDSEKKLFPLCRRVLNRIQYIQFSSLRMTTAFLFVSFLVETLSWNPRLMRDFGSLTASFSMDSEGLTRRILKKLETRWTTVIPKGSLSADELLEEVQTADYRDVDFFRLLWLRANLSECSSLLHAKLCLSVSEFLDVADKSAAILSILVALLHSRESLNTEIVANVIGYILLRVAVMVGKPSDYLELRQVYFPFFRKFSDEASIRLIEAVAPNVCKDLFLSTQRLAILCTVMKHVADGWKGDLCHLHPVVVKYLGPELIALPRCKKTPGLSAKEYAVLVGEMHAASLDLFIKLLPLFATSSSPESDVEECIAQLDCASSYAVKERLLTVIEMRISHVKDSSVMLSALNAAAVVVNEEKKSQNSLPSVAKLLKIGMQANMLAEESVAERTKELFGKFAEMASLSLSVSLVLANALKSAEEHLTHDWAKEVMCVAIFGPVPKKDNRVLSAAYDEIYSGELEGELPPSEFERVHEVVQRARFRAFGTAVRCSLGCPTFAVGMIKEILVESAALDKSSSKSFGLSLAHRQKTRVVSLLLFIMETIKIQPALDAVFKHCLYCVLDPCQQFSIKLVVEWILVRLCLKDENLKDRLIGAEKALAKQRIGSVSSWINTMVHICRVEKSEATISRLISVIVPWTSAQNFAVRCTAIAGLKLMFSMLSPEVQQKYELVQRIVDFDSEWAGNSRRIIDNLTGDFYFAFLNMKDHLNLQTVFVELPLKTGLPHEETIPLYLIQKLNTTRFPSMNTDHQFHSAPSLVYAALSKSASCAPDIDVDPEDVEATEQPDISFQKKIITKERVKKDDCSMIVVASLIDKPNNLGGLCRTSEIFGVDTLVLADLLMANDNGFKALSMSSEKWQHLEAVRPDQLLPYLENLRKEGYTVIAAEQTTDSVPLHKFTFPKKCVLLMGDEKEGVPTRLLRAVDQTVEIEQLGQTRSLNVHVTAALFIAKYAEQILL